MSLTIRNLGPSSVVFSKPGNSAIVWKPSGDPMGDDVKSVPDTMAEDPDFIQSYSLGIFTAEGGDKEIVAELTRAADAYNARRRKVEAAETGYILDRSADKSVLSFPCLGPGPNGKGHCGNQVLIPQKDRDQVAPLCTLHSGLANEFTLHETGSPGQGASDSTRGAVKREWKRIDFAR